MEVIEVDSGDRFEVMSNTTEATVEFLHPFYTYACRVAAETIATGVYGDQISVQLLEEGKTTYTYDWTLHLSRICLNLFCSTYVSTN